MARWHDSCCWASWARLYGQEWTLAVCETAVQPLAAIATVQSCSAGPELLGLTAGLSHSPAVASAAVRSAAVAQHRRSRPDTRYGASASCCAAVRGGSWDNLQEWATAAAWGTLRRARCPSRAVLLLACADGSRPRPGAVGVEEMVEAEAVVAHRREALHASAC